MHKLCPFWMSYFDSHQPGLRELQQMVAQLLHPGDIKPHIWRSTQGLDQSSCPIIHAHPGNDLKNGKIGDSRSLIL